MGKNDNALPGGEFQEAAPQAEKQKPQKNKNKGDKRPNIFMRIWRFIKEMISELKKVSWPKAPKVAKQTLIVVAVVFVFLLVLIGIDSFFAWLLDLLTRQRGGA